MQHRYTPLAVLQARQGILKVEDFFATGADQGLEGLLAKRLGQMLAKPSAKRMPLTFNKRIAS